MGLKKHEVLAVLDRYAESCEFPMLNNGYAYPVDVRLSAYGDGSRWALVIEHLSVSNREFWFDNFVYGFGNCLSPQRKAADFVSVEAYENWMAAHAELQIMVLHNAINDGSSPLLDFDEGLELLSTATDLYIREKLVQLPAISDYRARGIVLSSPPKVMLYELMRYLLLDHREDLVATETELRDLVPGDLPLLLRLNQWTHPDLADGEKPSDTETFDQLAEVVVNADGSGFRASELQSNTHWSNWPDGGTL